MSGILNLLAKASKQFNYLILLLAVINNKEKIVEINFEWQKCKNIFNCDVGQVSVDEKIMHPKFENKLVCPKCGVLTMNDVHLTELGQGQLTEATMNL
ncbi:MAG: hypothetical protein PF495_12380 [Spirochaetales bacterium]|nr:hypothetical protein [Spirochaetales bacterium]